jgi:uncharacterized membrane protein SpoIIM required for sporulation
VSRVGPLARTRETLVEVAPLVVLAAVLFFGGAAGGFLVYEQPTDGPTADEATGTTVADRENASETTTAGTTETATADATDRTTTTNATTPEPFGGPETTLDFFVNNALASAVLVGGGLLLGMPTVAGLVQNGLTVGTLVAQGLAVGISAEELALLLVPHGVFEVPAFLLAGAAGLYLPRELYRYLVEKRDRGVDREDLLVVARLCGLSAVLLLAAAYVEANVTGTLV